MAEVTWTEPALQELDAIAEYIALDNPDAASHLVQEVLEKTERLEDFPNPDGFRRSSLIRYTGSWWFHRVAFFIVRMISGFSSSMSCERNGSFVRTCLGTASPYEPTRSQQAWTYPGTAYGLMHKESFPEVPPRTEYSPTKSGRKLIKIIQQIQDLDVELSEKSETSA